MDSMPDSTSFVLRSSIMSGVSSPADTDWSPLGVSKLKKLCFQGFVVQFEFEGSKKFRVLTKS